MNLYKIFKPRSLSIREKQNSICINIFIFEKFKTYVFSHQKIHTNDGYIGYLNIDKTREINLKNIKNFLINTLNIKNIEIYNTDNTYMIVYNVEK